MKLLKLHAENFWSYEKLDFDFNQGLCLIEGRNYDEDGSNGAGKSALLNAICFSLFGDLPKKVKLDDVVNTTTGKECIVELTLQEGAINYRVLRGRKPATLIFEIDGKKVSDIDVKKTQLLIERHLGITLDTFLSSVYFSQNSLNFLSLNDDQKKSILTDILNLGVFDAARELVQHDIVTVKSDVSSFASKLTLLKSQQLTLQSEDNTLRDKLKFYEQDRLTKINSVKGEIASFNPQIVALEDGMIALAKELETRELEFAQWTSQRSTKEQSFKLIKSGIAEVQAKISVINGKISLLDHDARKFDVKEPVCIKCFQPVNFDLLRDSKNAVLAEREKQQLELECVQDELAKLPTVIDLDNTWQQFVSKEQELKFAVQRLKDKLTSDRTLRTNLVAREVSLSENLKRIEAEANPYNDLLIELQHKIDKTCNDIISAQTELETKEAKLTDLQALSDVFSQKGVKSYVFDTVVSELNARVNQYLTTLFERSFRFDLLPETNTAKGAVKQVFGVKLTVDGDEVSMGRLSGGEERRLSFAVNLALADIIACRSTKGFNFMALDEAFDGLDPEGKGRCMELLAQLTKQKDCILVIDHSSEHQAQYDKIVRVEKRGGVSTLTI